MTPGYALLVLALLCLLSLAAYVDRLYSEMGKFLAREFQENIDAWTRVVEPRLHMGRESVALSAGVLRQILLAAIAGLFGFQLAMHAVFFPLASHLPKFPAVAETALELVLVVMVFDRLLPYVFFTRTKGLWIARISLLMQVLFYLVTPVTLLLSLLLSIAALAEHAEEQPESPAEAVEALLEAGEEEGILEESDRELVRSVVEFGDKITREVMTPRPEMFAVPESMTLADFTAALNEQPYSRVPVYREKLDQITGIAFARDLLQVLDMEAAQRTVAEIKRPAAFVPETKKVNELLREMQHAREHMSVVIDEYGGVAGVVTIEDLLEAIVGNIADEHEEHTEQDAVVQEADGTYSVPGSFEVARLRELFAEELDALETEEASTEDSESDANPLRLPDDLEAATLGGMVTELAGHIPQRGEVVESAGLRFEVLASTDRLVERVRVGLLPKPDSDLQ